jgi:hypothetical protein
MSSSKTPSMTSTYSATSTMLFDYKYTPKPEAPIVQNTNNNNALNTPLIVLIMSFISITIVCMIYNIVCFNIQKKRRDARERIIENNRQQITVISPIVVHENPLHSVNRVYV